MLKIKRRQEKMEKDVMYSMYGTCEWGTIVRTVVRAVMSQTLQNLYTDEDWTKMLIIAAQ